MRRSYLFVRLALIILLLSLISTFALAQGAKMKNPDKDGDKDRADRQAARQRWFRKGRTLPDGRPAAEALTKANQQKMEARQAREVLLRQTTDAMQSGVNSTSKLNFSLNGSATTSWFPMGAAPMSPDGTGFQDYGPSIGRATAVTVDQSDPSGNSVWLGGAYGGVWYSPNAAATPASMVEWVPMLDSGVSLAVGAIGVQPGNGNVVVVGTGEANNSADSYYGVGIYRTTDKGKNWNLITASADGHNLRGLAFSRISWSRTNTNVLIMGSNFGNAVNAANTSIVRGAYYSTDAGATWRLATFKDGATTVTGDRYGANNPLGLTVSSVYWNPGDAKFYAAVMDHGFYVSAANDPSTFTRMASQPAAAGSVLNNLANCPAAGINLAPNQAYPCGITRGEITSVPGRNEMYVFYVGGGIDRGVWKTTDNGATWMPVKMTNFDACDDGDGTIKYGCGISQGTYNLWLAAVPNPTTPTNTDVYIAAVNQFKCTVRSTDDSSNACASTNAEPFKWLNLTHVYGCPPYGITAHVHPDQHAVDYSLSNLNVMYFAHDGGVSRNLNPGSMVSGACTAHHPFENLSGTMGSMMEFVWATPHPTDDRGAIGGTQDNGSAATNSTIANLAGNIKQNWTAIHGGDGGYNDIRPSSNNTWFTSYFGVSVQRCTTGFTCTDATFAPFAEQSDVGGDASAFYTPYALDPQDDTKLLVGTCRIWKGSSTAPDVTNNTAWSGTPPSAISPKLSNGTVGVCSGADDFVTSIGFGGANSGGSKVLWATTDLGQVWRTGNADAGVAATWTVRNPPAAINPNIWTNRFPVSSVAVDRMDATGNTAFITVQGFQVGHVARTTDGGLNWTNITGTLPDAPANNVTIDPDDHNVIYVGTDVGVFVSVNALAPTPTWVEVGPTNSANTAGWLPNAVVNRVTITKANGKKKLIAVTYGRGLWYADLLQAGLPNANVTPTTLDFGKVNRNSTTTKTSTITNSGTGNLTITAIVNLGYTGEYNVTHNCNNGNLPATLTANASCTITVNFHPTTLGTHDATVVVTSDSGGIAGTQSTVVLKGTAEDFGIPTVATTNVTVSKGGTANFGTVTIPAAGGYSSAITMSCTGLPAGAHCVFATNPIPAPGIASATTTLTINTTASTATRPVIASNHSTRKPLMAFWLAMPGMALLLPAFAGSKRRKWLVRIGLIAFCLLMLISLTACGSGSSSGGPAPTPGTPAGTYNVGVVASSGTLSHSSNITLTVQ